MNKKSLTKFNTTTLDITTAILSLGILLSVWFNFPEIIGLIIFFLFSLSIGYTSGKYLLSDLDIVSRTIFGVVAIYGILTIILSGIYWFFQINKVIVSASIIVLTALMAYLNTTIKLKKPKFLRNPIKNLNYKKLLFFLMITVGYASLFVLLFLHRSGDTIISPWIPLTWRFFILFFFTTSLLLYFLQIYKERISSYILLIFHFGIFFLIALILYKHGFGFDPFIHQATEKWIAENGYITPKKPFYIGQYMLVLFAHFATNISIHLVDSALVPVAATILIPFTVFFCMQKQNKKLTTVSVALLPILLLNQFIVTTPNNLALLFSVILLFWTWFEWGKEKIGYHLFGIILTLTTLAVHPFIGIPTSVFYFGSLFFRYTSLKNRINWLLYISVIILSLPLIMALYILFTNSGQVTNPLYQYQSFLNIFDKPHWYLFGGAEWYWQAVYYIKVYFWKYLLVFLAITGFIFVKDKKSKFYLSTAVGLFCSSFLLATIMNFSKIISYEETVFAQRLLDLSLLTLTPGLIISIEKILNYASKRINKNQKNVVISLVSATILALSLYFTYPTRDAVSKYTGYNVRTADLKAVEFIDKINNKKDYIVITNQMIGAAALKEFGFAKYIKLKNGSKHYFYSIPTGGALYKKFFSKMVYKKPKRKWMKQAMNFAGTDKAYFVHTDYWYPAAKIRDEAKKYADRFWNFENKVWVFEYKK